MISVRALVARATVPCTYRYGVLRYFRENGKIPFNRTTLWSSCQACGTRGQMWHGNNCLCNGCASMCNIALYVRITSERYLACEPDQSIDLIIADAHYALGLLSMIEILPCESASLLPCSICTHFHGCEAYYAGIRLVVCEPCKVLSRAARSRVYEVLIVSVCAALNRDIARQVLAYYIGTPP